MGKTCTKNGAEEVTDTIRGELKNLELLNEIHTTKTLCNGQCKHGPIVVLYPQGTWYKEMNKEKSEELVQQLKEEGSVHLGSELYYHDGKTFKNPEDEL
ncbi:ferredoxin [Bacillus sp. SA1-12]|uniref:(2Fe-2S) ferredoxin domain-containing protein n=1 Tax=Bacillus sp. SA1-12 TaxID=1455638 RepID=UPI000695F4AB|nr:(2Fe-2S) ferredoxin domain-containing protein [Bacillus sp. SA1-12]